MHFPQTLEMRETMHHRICNFVLIILIYVNTPTTCTESFNFVGLIEFELFLFSKR